ncbi:hypothetical protein [Candidatus Nanohalococcus occultus]|uniref:Uncharacterized protein n=1 Tax=Candidatus Nanohalococcus occultus TaxID=2978047 RepID=A0ABY8CFQ6_9ARCH|nr:hypothetical protein SVXNc_1030 [Candidatus Nanohaloarchaeota archaeon SVXNc]
MVVHLYHGVIEPLVAKGIAKALDEGDSRARTILDDRGFLEDTESDVGFEDSDLVLSEQGEGYVVYEPASRAGQDTENDVDPTDENMLGQNPGTDTDGGENRMTNDLDRHANNIGRILDGVENGDLNKADAIEGLHQYMTEEVGYGQARQFADRYEDLVDKVVDMKDEVRDRVDEHEQYAQQISNEMDTQLSNLESYIDFMSNELDHAEARMDRADSRLDL